MNVQQLLESSNQYKNVMEDSKKLSTKWAKSGLLEGIKSENDKNIMSTLLENQAKQLVTEASQTGGQSSGAGAYSGESWNGVALPLVRRVFGDIAAKEFVSVQPMNLPSGLVFYPSYESKRSLILSYYGQGDRIRTHDILVPNQALYQTELHPDYFFFFFFLTPL